MTATTEILIGEGVIDGTIHEAAGPGLLDECWKLNCYTTGEYTVTLGYNLPSNYAFHTLGSKDKNDNKVRVT